MLEATTTKPIPDLVRRPRLLAALWAATGLTLALAGSLSHVPQVAPAFVIASVILWGVVYRQGGSVRAWLDAIPQRALLAVHVIRLPIGALFVWEAANGRLPSLFATRAGYGDIAIGAAAIVVAAIGWRRRGVVLAFSLLGLADILLALGTGMYLMFRVHDPLMLDAITRMPYPLLPLLIVPAVILTHLLVLVRVRAGR